VAVIPPPVIFVFIGALSSSSSSSPLSWLAWWWLVYGLPSGSKPLLFGSVSTQEGGIWAVCSHPSLSGFTIVRRGHGRGPGSSSFVGVIVVVIHAYCCAHIP